MKKLLAFFLIFTAIIISWFSAPFYSPPIEEAKHIFDTSIYTHYRTRMKDFIVTHPLYEKVKISQTTPHNQKAKIILQEITDFSPSNEQREQHESLVKKIRELASVEHENEKEEKEARTIFEDLVNWLFLKANLKQDMQSFLYACVSNPHQDFYRYLQETQKTLHDRFGGIRHFASSEDQLLQGNLPSFIQAINQTKLIRIGQPVRQSSRSLWWWSSPEVSQEFLLFLKRQPHHFYINLMKRKGVEGPLTHTLEKIENQYENFYLITLDKNSSFYWQKNPDYPENLESFYFKKIFIEKMSTINGNYFWSKHLNFATWKEQLQEIVNEVHSSVFNDKEILNRKERKNFIEITYLRILDYLVEKWNPTSMNITCRQGMDRGPSLMVLWMLEKGGQSKEEMAALLLAPPLILHNRASHSSRIERLISAAEQLGLK